MKKKLKSELVSLAHRILKLDSDSDYREMQEEARRLYEAFTVLAFAERQFDAPKPTLEQKDIIETFEEKEVEEVAELFDTVQKTPVQKQKPETVAEITKANQELFEKARKKEKKSAERDSFFRPDGTEHNENDEALYEPVIEKIKDMVAQMPSEADDIDDMFHEITGKPEYAKNDMKDVGEFGRMAEFEEKKPMVSEKPKSLNDKLTKGIAIGLNDRIAFIKQLFNGSTSDYNRVLSQLNTLGSKAEAYNFIRDMVKPDYNGWAGKEVYEVRFLEHVEKKFDH
ncbi:hypothetical protein ACH3O9_07360 [Leeuwenhoekiella sp. A16]|uniref:hypothetical protein n=1 Tax=unclassified Leeuwenhoekiella TaxID=2615029 RepID=UPI003A808B4A